MVTFAMPGMVLKAPRWEHETLMSHLKLSARRSEYRLASAPRSAPLLPEARVLARSGTRENHRFIYLGGSH